MEKLPAIVFIFFFCIAISGKDLATIDGTLYKNVTVLRKTSMGVEILHSGGACFIRYKDMPPHARKEFGYNPKAEKKLMARKVENFRKKISELDRKIPLGKIHKFEHEGTEYFFYAPLSSKKIPLYKLPLLVSVHGTSRQAEYFTKVFVDSSEEYGVAILAPLFDEETFPLYHYSMYPGDDLLLEKNKRVRADLRLIDILKNFKKEFTVLDINKFYIFGFSGGAQFAIRFSALYPHKIIRGAAAGAGSYLFPNEEKDYPIGIKDSSLYPNVNVKGFLDTPFCIMVGEKDTDSLIGVKTLPEYQFQGDTRVQRMENFYKAMKSFAEKNHCDFKLRKRIVPWAGHNLRSMIPYSEDFLFEKKDL
jgi:poly(3-hydroxybutyrate) depolymerase